MARGRFISNTLGESHKFARLANDTHRLLYVLLITHTDVNGRVDADPIWIKGKVTTRLPITDTQITEALRDMHRVGLITHYRVRGMPYLEITNFTEHNTIRKDREAKPTIPGPEEGVLDANPPTPEELRSNSGTTPAEVQVEVQVQEKFNTSSPTATERDKHQPFQDAWNTNRGALPQARGLNDTRKKQIDRLIRSHGSEAIELFTDAVRQVAREPYWLERGYGIGNLLSAGKVLNWAEKYRSSSTARTAGVGTSPPRFRQHDLVYRPSDKAQAEITQLIDERTAVMDTGETWDLTGCERWTN